MTCYRKDCQENHTGPVDLVYPQNRIGSAQTGYTAFSKFVANGGYGVDQTVLDTIASLNATYQGIYDTLQAEADGIYEWSLILFNCVTGEAYESMAEWETARHAKRVRRREIDAEIDDAWETLTNYIRGLVGDSAYEEFSLA